MNTASLEGTLQRAAHLTAGKNPIALFTVNVPRENGKGSDWIDCKAYGKKAEAIATAAEGDAISLHGSLRSESWGEGAGRKHALRVKVDAMTINGVEVGVTADDEPAEAEAEPATV